ncbi:DgyrCDS10982 [Dimorphilus gyrociliatus]|uniref:DgyrCDS10982 n=1 Tax=Dimorphilus gyrociliatus TaxID=2664684 RepID=A0A7I8W202_9ANNE|nr:DgyrCDS10982 [Dimorphilus gyrociliatus]
MPRGGKRGSHKGARRHFTNPEELEHKRKQEEEERSWREQRGDIEEEGSNESEEESSDDDSKKKGVEGVIDVHNPNRVSGRQHRKATELNEIDSTKPQLSRREREELEKQQARSRYEKLHAEGKTDEARADLARLALIRKQREEAAKRREEEKKAKDAASKAAVQEEKLRRAGRKN